MAGIMPMGGGGSGIAMPANCLCQGSGILVPARSTGTQDWISVCRHGKQRACGFVVRPVDLSALVSVHGSEADSSAARDALQPMHVPGWPGNAYLVRQCLGCIYFPAAVPPDVQVRACLQLLADTVTDVPFAVTDVPLALCSSDRCAVGAAQQCGRQA